MQYDRPIILIVDDQSENRETIKDILADAEFELNEAENGQEALEFIGHKIPDLIVLDAMMPLMDGFEVARQVRSNPQTRLIPIIMITALDSLQDRVKGLEAGVDDFISRPFNIFELRARIKNLLRLRESLSELENAEQVIFSLAKAVEAKDKYTENHCNRLANLAEAMGQFLGSLVTSFSPTRQCFFSTSLPSKLAAGPPSPIIGGERTSQLIRYNPFSNGPPSLVRSSSFIKPCLPV